MRFVPDLKFYFQSHKDLGKFIYLYATHVEKIKHSTTIICVLHNLK